MQVKGSIRHRIFEFFSDANLKNLQFQTRAEKGARNF